MMRPGSPALKRLPALATVVGRRPSSDVILEQLSAQVVLLSADHVRSRWRWVPRGLRRAAAGGVA
jgi:hypothetical protein